MKRFIATAAICMLPLSANAVEFTNLSAKYLYDKAMEGNNTTVNLLYAYVIQGNSDQAMIEAAKSVSQTVDNDDIPEAPKVSIPTAKAETNAEDVGYATFESGDHGFEGTYSAYDLDENVKPDEYEMIGSGEWILNNSNTDFIFLGKIELNKERTRTHDVSDHVHNYSDTIYVVETKNKWGNEAINLLYQYSGNVSVGHNYYDECQYATCINDKVYYVHSNTYNINSDGELQYWSDDHTAAEYNGMTRDEIVEHIIENPVEHATHWRAWDRDNTFVITRNGKTIADVETTSLWKEEDFKFMKEILNEVATEAYNSGYVDGYEDGYAAGYADGFADGVASVQSKL